VSDDSVRSEGSWRGSWVPRGHGEEPAVYGRLRTAPPSVPQQPGALGKTTSATNTGESRAIEKFLDNAAMLLHEQASTRLVEYDCSNVNIAGRAGQAMLPT